MWYPAAITVAAGAEPVSLAQARTQCGITADDTYFDPRLTINIAAARSHCEKRNGVRYASQTVAIKCDGFADFTWLPEAPVTSIASITYVDTAGAAQTLSTDVYELRADGYEASIALKFGQTWPAIQAGSRVTVTAVVGFAAAPGDVLLAMLQLISHWFEHSDAVNIGNIVQEIPHSVDALLCNHRR